MLRINALHVLLVIVKSVKRKDPYEGKRALERLSLCVLKLEGLKFG
jgi:hypothetical protein